MSYTRSDRSRKTGMLFLIRPLLANVCTATVLWKSITASTIPVHCSASSSLFARHSARSRGSRNPRYSAIFLLEFTIYRIYQLLLFVACFRIGSSLRSIFALPTLVPHSTLHFSAYCERVLRTSSRLPFVGECSQCLGGYTFIFMTFVILSGGLKM